MDKSLMTENLVEANQETKREERFGRERERERGMCVFVFVFEFVFVLGSE